MTGPTERLPGPQGDAVPGPTERLPVGDRSIEDLTTVELPRPEPIPAAPRRSGFWRELSGALAIGLCVLALVVLGMQVFAGAQGMPGPGIGVVLGHFGAAVAAVVAQRFADRRRGPEAALAIVLVGIATGIAIWFFWWA
ncbi:hypothetical protein [Actinokineospora sp.]|uniref:hypothetical protein n=1 Tax=Actinokineospora sp. TaxID=1872133 RepID=UPI004037E418